MDYVGLIEDEFGSDYDYSTSETPLSDYHLRNPLKEAKWYFQDKLPKRQYKDRQKIREMFSTEMKFGLPSTMHAELYDLIPDMSDQALTDAISDLLFKLRIDNNILPPGCRAPVDEIVRSMSNSDRLYWNGMRFWNLVLLNMNAMSSNRTVPSGISDIPVSLSMKKKYKAHVFRTCVIISIGNQPKLYDGDWIRMISDFYTQRWIVLMAARIGRCISEEHYPTEELLLNIFRWGDELLSQMKNEGYKVIKTFESIIIGYLQCLGSSTLVPADRFLRNTMRDLRESDIRMSSYARRLVEILSTVQNRHHIIQCYGMHRTWGHPTVDSTAGMLKLMKIGRKQIMQNTTLCKDAGRMFKLLFCKEYRSKNGNYPPIVENETLLSTEILENDPVATMNGQHSLEEWDRIRFTRAFKLPETFNLSLIVADKAISPTRSELVDLIKSKGTVMDGELRRGVRRWLNDKSLNPARFLEDIDNGIFPSDHLIIGLTPKERELNNVPRMFSLMSHLLRVYVVITEQMLSDHILEMFPQITMTDSLLDLTRKMYNTVKNQSSLVKHHDRAKGWCSRTVCISLDFEKWNGHMRREMTHGVFTAIGELFGLPDLYNATYDLFSKSYYYLADGSYVPTISEEGNLVVEEPNSFMNHLGGMEGLRQKGWTLYTVCGLEVILSKYDCVYKIMGMGDNQVLQITVYTKMIDDSGRPTEQGVREMRTLLGKIFDDLVSSFTKSGLPLKPLETWMSEDLYLYGKVPIWRGVPLTMDLKKLMRTFGLSNQGVMTLENALSTISSNAMAATQTGTNVWTAYCVYNVMTSICIADFFSYHPILGKGLYVSRNVEGAKVWTLRMPSGFKQTYSTEGTKPLSAQILRRLIITVPKSLTGYCGVNIYEMMVRGFSDRLSRDLSYIMNLKLSDKTPKWMKECLDNWISPIYMPDQNYEMLLEDVCAINLLSPRSPMSGVRQVVNRFMKDGMNITNPEFMQLINARNDTDCKYLAECLCEHQELHVRLLHDVYDATVFGYVDSVLSKVTKTTTIQRLAIQSDSVKVFSTISSDEINYFSFFKWRCVNRGEKISSKCATTMCKVMREVGWKKKIRGVTVPFPLSYLIETKCGSTGICSCPDGFLSIHYPDKQIPNDLWNNEIGGNPPYLGSMTKEKVIIGTGGKIYSAEPLIKRPINLLRTINWFIPRGSNMEKVISACASAVTDLDLERFYGMSEGTAGSEAHRYQDSSTFRGALTSCNYLFSTRCHVSTDNLVRYSKGAENTDFHYQASFCVLLELSNMYLTKSIREGRVIERFKHFKQCCYECIQPIEEDFIDLPSTKALMAIPSYPTNEYLYTSSERIRIAEKLHRLHDMSNTVLTSEQYNRIPPMEKRIMLERIVCDRILKDITSGKTDSTHTAIGLTSVKSYERTMYFKLDARNLIKTVMAELYKICSWTVLRSHPESVKATPTEIRRVMINKIQSVNSHCFLGLGMFYCWTETSERFGKSYPEIVPPTTNPVSIDSACESVRTSLIALISRGWTVGIKRHPIIADDEKNDGLIYKILLYDYVKSHTSCKSCRAETGKMEISEVMKGLGWKKCYYGHLLGDIVKRAPWIKSFITVERLRKDCDSSVTDHQMRILATDRRLNRDTSFVISLFEKGHHRIRHTVSHYQEAREHDVVVSSGLTQYHLLTVASLPTSTIYKVQDILNSVRNRIIGRTCLCVGDGLGSSSLAITLIGSERVVSSTMIEPDNAIPHSYAHNTLPISLVYNVPNVVSELAVSKHNDIRCNKWRSDWDKDINQCEVIYSDAEVVNPDEHTSRNDIVKKLVQCGPKSLIVIKDYIWSAEEFANRIGIMQMSKAKNWELVTTKFRSHHYPEVWWRLYDVPSVSMSNYSSPIVDHIRPIWNDIRRVLNDDHSGDEISTAQRIAISLMTPIEMTVKMKSFAVGWLTFANIGSMLPTGGNYTALFLYLSKTKRPKFARSTEESRFKLYDSDYYDLRTKIFAMAVSMVGDISMRRQMLVQSSSWHLVWTLIEDKWEVSLIYDDEERDRECDVIKVVPILSILMAQQGLLFSSVGNEVKFRHDKGRNKLCFPISYRSNVLRKEAMKKAGL